MNGNIVVTYLNGALVSSDGANWSCNFVLPAASDGYYDVERNQHILFNNKLYSVGGYHYTTADDYYAVDSLVTESSNLSSWTVKTGVTGLTDGVINHVGLAFNNAMWVISGTTESLFDDWLVTNAVWKSTDGVNWVEQNATGLTPRGEAAGVVYNGRIYITGGYMDGGREELNDVVASSDGLTWTTLTTNPGWLDRNGHTLVANSQGMWLIGGNGGDNSEFFNDVWFSSDGVTWTSKGDAPFAPRAGHASVVKDGYLYVIGGVTDDGETYLSDVWRAYIGGNDLDASSYSIEPATLTITNSGSYPITSLSINDSGSNELSSNLAVGSSWQKQFDPGTYSFTVRDTQERHQSFSVTIGTASQTKTIGTSGWTEPVVVISQYTLTIRNYYNYAVSAVYVRKSGTSEWGPNLIGSSTIAPNGSRSLGKFDAGQYEIRFVSQKKSTGTNATGGANTKRPGSVGLAKERIVTASYSESFNLTGDRTVDAPSAASRW
jgi:N-acetylneuraminic acid mutarotase